MSVVVKVRNGYTLHVGRDPGNWVTGPKTIRVRDKALLAGQMRKVEMVQDDGTPAPVIVKDETPAKGNQGVQDTFWGRGDVEELNAKKKGPAETAEDDYLRRRVKADEILEKGNADIQAKAKNRVAAADEFMSRQQADRRRDGIVEIIDDPTAVETSPAAVTEDEIFRARPITQNEGGIEIIGEEEVHEIGAGRPPEPAPAPPEPEPNVQGSKEPGKLEKVTVEGIPRATVQRALNIATTYPLEKVDQAVKLLDGAEKGLIYVFKPTEFRDKITAAVREKTAELVKESERLRIANQELVSRVEAAQAELEATNKEAEVLAKSLTEAEEEVEKMQREYKDRMMTPAADRQAKPTTTKKATKKASKKVASKSSSSKGAKED